ncbi:hypothetical protein GCM10012285_29260 [Streptomyces kronopolitis]|uniref:DUF2993 domain-containing protein n=1 Tax=Streptomyces kronopolitis TaxID=1612435 RepID=A0ABQ2JHT5_9ACTN|nr:hypothetical protein [Streptomyces kronopolitis]GGN45551.1 hypothetical protein GCM10012285_29260 [Streptomyces kronopolitis]
MRARLLATAAVLAVTSTLLAAAPAPADASAVPGPPGASVITGRRAGNTEVPVTGGTARFEAPPKLLAALEDHGVTIARLDAHGRISRQPASDAGVRMDIEGGVVTNSGGKVGGELRFARTGLALLNSETGKSVRLSDFVGDLSQGALRARLNHGRDLTVGTFTQSATKAAVDTDTARLRMNVGIKVTAAAAARLNAALGTKVFTAGGPLLHARVDVRLDSSVDLRTALNLNRRPARRED